MGTVMSRATPKERPLAHEILGHKKDSSDNKGKVKYDDDDDEDARELHRRHINRLAISRLPEGSREEAWKREKERIAAYDKQREERTQQAKDVVIIATPEHDLEASAAGYQCPRCVGPKKRFPRKQELARFVLHPLP